MYLSSWGMYRGSSFLLQKDYKIHKPIIVEALKDDGAKSDMPRDCGMHSDVIYYVDEHGYVWNYPYLDMDRLHLPSYYVKGNYKLKHRL